jgi:hypothetical protein
MLWKKQRNFVPVKIAYHVVFLLDSDKVIMLKISKIVSLTSNPESQQYENHWYYY